MNKPKTFSSEVRERAVRMVQLSSVNWLSITECISAVKWLLLSATNHQSSLPLVAQQLRTSALRPSTHPATSYGSIRPNLKVLTAISSYDNLLVGCVPEGALFAPGFVQGIPCSSSSAR